MFCTLPGLAKRWIGIEKGSGLRRKGMITIWKKVMKKKEESETPQKNLGPTLRNSRQEEELNVVSV